VAVGFKLSNVLNIDVIEDKNILVFTTKHLVYEIWFDNETKFKEILRAFSKFKFPKKSAKPNKPKIKFYKDIKRS